jgi:DNA-binding XRE family transcriptional regulator/ketosteroid isomerase-like protein
MKQPELGKKIATLRQAKGLTQEELAEKCNVSIRTVQRIESAEVFSRSYTIKMIFEGLDYRYSSGIISSGMPEQIYHQFLDLFNLKTNTMKKVMILSAPFVSLLLVFLLTGMDSQAQNNARLKAEIETKNSNMMRWFNDGQIDSLMTLYHESASISPGGAPSVVGKAQIRNYYVWMHQQGFKMIENQSEKLVVDNKTLVDRGSWKIRIGNDQEIHGAYLSQWRKEGREWVIENEMSNATMPWPAEWSMKE